MTINKAINAITDEKACEYQHEYYWISNSEDTETIGPAYAGSYFESLDRDIWENHPNRITGSDLYALSTLQISVPRAAGIGILGDEQRRITELLTEIPDERLENLSREDYEKHLGRESPAQKLWDLLCRNNTGDKKWGIGSTTASKIMARKRPHLIPIQDSVVDEVIDRNKLNAWELWWQAFRDNEELADRAEKFRQYIDGAKVTRPQLSTLRIFDVVLWMHGRRQRQQK